MVAFTLVWISWAAWSMIGRSHPYDLRVLDDLGMPIDSAVVDSEGSQVGITGSDGRVELVWHRSADVLEVSAPGHISQVVTLSDPPESDVDVVLKARVLRGRVISADGEGVEGALVDAGSGQAFSDGSGYFQIRGAEEGTVSVDRPAWQSSSFEWNGGAGDSVVELEPFIARGVHIGGPEARDDFARFVSMARDTELNALVIDLKDETGEVFFNSGNALAAEVGAVRETFDLASAVAQAHDLGLYVVGRIVLFNDPIAAVQSPELAVWDSATNSPYESNGQSYLDPTDPVARQYGIDLAVEACRAGVDEIQFDYVRFPDDRRDSATFDGGVSPEVRVSAVTAFLSTAIDALRPLGCAVAADIFGYLTTATDDGGIGQRWEDVANIVDVISPMLYPSHYDPGWWGFEDPDAVPGEMIDRALADGMERLSTQVVVRPWLQDFGYEVDQVKAQIAAVEDYGLGWMLWNAASEVTTEALQPAE